MKHDDFLSADPRTRHAHRPLLDHVPSEIRILEAWTHIFDFMTPHRHTCIAPHGAYAPADADDAAELRVRKADLLAKREALHETRGKWQSDDAFIDLVRTRAKTEGSGSTTGARDVEGRSSDDALGTSRVGPGLPTTRLRDLRFSGSSLLVKLASREARFS